MKHSTGILLHFLSRLILTSFVPTILLSQSMMAPIDELAARAEIIAVGKVTGLVSEWNETRTMIRTRVTLAVNQYVKGGSTDHTLTIYVAGGEVDGVGEIYSHMPTFRRDEDVVVFAEKDKENRYRVSTGSQGKFSIERNKITGKAMIPGGKSLDELTTKLRIAVQEQKNEQ